MLEINKKNARMWSMLGARGTFGHALTELAAENSFYVATADLCESSGLAKFRNEYSDRFVNVGIAEQNLIGIAAGMASDDIPVFATSFAPFITERCLDQIRMNLGYMQANVKLIGLSSGFEQGSSGNSHYGTEDAAVINCIPGITIITPADAAEIVQALRYSLTHKGPVYIRLTGGRFTPVVYTEEYDFSAGKNIQLREGSDAAIFANGVMVSNSLKAAKILSENGIEVSVINAHSLKPFDTESAVNICKSVKLAVTAEEHSIRGGLGTALAETIAESGCASKLIRLGAPDAYTKAGSMQHMIDKNGITAEKIAERIANELNCGII